MFGGSIVIAVGMAGDCAVDCDGVGVCDGCVGARAVCVLALLAAFRCLRARCWQALAGVGVLAHIQVEKYRFLMKWFVSREHRLLPAQLRIYCMHNSQRRQRVFILSGSRDDRGCF